ARRGASRRGRVEARRARSRLVRDRRRRGGRRSTAPHRLWPGGPDGGDLVRSEPDGEAGRPPSPPRPPGPAAGRAHDVQPLVPVGDDRLDRVAEVVGAAPVVYETIAFHDIAGLIRGAHRGEGLGNQFLANIRETDAIVHVVRAHEDPHVVHPEGRVDPASDLEAVRTELLYAD